MGTQLKQEPGDPPVGSATGVGCGAGGRQNHSVIEAVSLPSQACSQPTASEYFQTGLFWGKSNFYEWELSSKSKI